MFVTVWLGIMEFSTGKLTTSNAGHEYPAIMRNNGDFEFYIDKHGLPLGVKKNYSYVNHEIMLEDGDKIFVYTDGITEASTSDKMMFGEDRLIEALNNHKSLDCKDLLEGVVNSVETFVGDATQFDDMTALCFEKKGNAIMEKSFKADVAELYSVLEYFESKVSDALDIKTVGAFNVAIEEVFVNIASYAYEGEGNTVDVSVTNDYANRLVKVVFKDSGVEFDPLAKSDPDVTLPAKKRAIGGLGIFMTKKLMDSVSYERVNDKNVLTIEKAY
jgi:sigma-B regulation protein RsbU (phosphoserine phosphatase)